jgi:hypothetical protein
MGFRGLWFCTIVMAAISGAANAAPKNIFDDDWVPPKPVTAPATGPRTTAKPSPSDPVVKPPITNASTTGPPLANSAPRRPVPERAAQDAVRKVMREVFADQLADASPAARRKLAQKLLAQAEQSSDAPVDRFVLLAAAIDAAVEGGTLPIAFAAADTMGAAFQVDPLAVKAEKVAKMNPKVGSDSAAENVAAGLDVADRLSAADDYAGAARLLASLQPLAAADGQLRAQVQQGMRALTATRVAREQVAKHLDKLKITPDDPAANLAVGQFLCFNKGDWAAGLQNLSRGSDPKLKRLAEQELLNPDTAEAQGALADAWWDLSATAAAPHKSPIQSHAAEWYERALPGLKGLGKAKAEKRLEVARATTGNHPGAPSDRPGASLGTMVVYANKVPQAAAPVKKGQRLTITAMGAWTNNNNENAALVWGPDGNRVDGLPGHNGYAELTAFIGQTIIRVGTEKTIQIPEDGTLRFGINDSESESAVADNHGQITVTVTAAPAK